MPSGTATAPPPTGECLSLHNDWFPSLWTHVLPRHQPMMIAMLFGTATVRRLEGELDDLVAQVFREDAVHALRLGDEGLDSPVLWVDDEDLADTTPQEAEEIHAAAAAHQEWLAAALRERSLAMPTTVRELAATMEALGLVRRMGRRWYTPNRLPLPEDVLTLPEELLQRLRKIRAVHTLQPTVQTLLAYFTDTLDHPEEVSTSLERLERVTGFSPDELRAALDYLVDETGEITLDCGMPPAPVAPKDLPAHARFRITINWDTIGESRICVVRGD
ncbi:DUF6042 family protein [Streptomyces sp. NPDC059631]|uniref:DUF6042 family protein n=1 Tax=unclassified Streptomyces TaxID=2593676 RepID=UPI0036C46959